MTSPSVDVTLARLEGKLDTLSVKVDAGDRATTGLVELVRTELGNVQKAVTKLELTIGDGLREADQAVSKVRTDLAGEIAAIRADGKVEREAQAQERRRLYDRLDALDKISNRLVGGLIFAGALGISGLVALIRGFS